MKTITKTSHKILYASGAFGVNLLNLVMGSYLCAALIAGDFALADVANHSYVGNDLVIASIWGVFVLVAKIVDGIIDIPMASFTDNLKTKFGRRRPSLIIGLVPMVIAYLLFLVVPQREATVLNTIYYGIVLCVFYSFYTLTMVTYYSTFSEIVDNQKDRQFISNVKAVVDIVYFILGFVAIKAMLGAFNVRLVGLMILPLVLMMLIPIFLIKEKSNLDQVDDTIKSERVDLFKSIRLTFSNKNFISWMIVSMILTFSSQLFLGGISPYFSATGMNMIYVMMASFAPVPLTIKLFNKIQTRKGFGMAILYTLGIFAISMILMFGVGFVSDPTLKLVLSIIAGLISSFAIGSIFSVNYSVPSELAAEEKETNGHDNSAMYFAVQGLFSGIATGLGTGPLLTLLRKIEIFNQYGIVYLTIICGVVALIGAIASLYLPKKVRNIGKTEVCQKEENHE